MPDTELNPGGSIIDPTEHIENGYSVMNCIVLAYNADNQTPAEEHPEMYLITTYHKTRIGYEQNNPNVTLDITIDTEVE